MTELGKRPRDVRRGGGARERILGTGMDQLCAVVQVSKPLCPFIAVALLDDAIPRKGGSR